MTHAAYKRFVDEMVAVARRSVASDRILKNGHPVRTNERDLALSAEEAALKAIFARLNDEERATLARAIEEERASALHDFASFIEWAATADDMAIHWGAETFGSSPFASMHYDFICRLNGDEWENA